MSRTMRMVAALGLVGLVVAALVIPAFADDTTMATNDNTQTAVNVAVSTQDAVAVSGDAKAEDKAIAKSGGAFVDQVVIQDQHNLQINANVAAAIGLHDEDTSTKADSDSDQTAANVAEAEQVGAAVSGDAKAEDKSAAFSGHASVDQFIKQDQSNVQASVNAAVAIGPDDDAETIAWNDSKQASANVAGAAQEAAALSGRAKAEDGSLAVSGGAYTDQAIKQGQDALQVNANVALALWPEDDDLIKADNDSFQESLQKAFAGQSAVAASGDAEAEDWAIAATAGAYVDQFTGQWQANPQINANVAFAW